MRFHATLYVPPLHCEYQLFLLISVDRNRLFYIWSQYPCVSAFNICVAIQPATILTSVSPYNWLDTILTSIAIQLTGYHLNMCRHATDYHLNVCVAIQLATILTSVSPCNWLPLCCLATGYHLNICVTSPTRTNLSLNCAHNCHLSSNFAQHNSLCQFWMLIMVLFLTIKQIPNNISLTVKFAIQMNLK